MKIGIMQPYLFPYIGYFQLIREVDIFVLLDNVSYIKKGWINRNRIIINGNEYMFTIPLKNSSQNKMIKDIQIVSDNKWKEKFLKTIEYGYKKAPYFKNTFPIICEIINNTESYLSRFIYNSLLLLGKYLKIDTTIIKSSSKYENDNLKAEHKIIDICKKEKADHYVNPIGGLEFYDKQSFYDNRIKISFLKTKEIHYKQLCNYFIQNLSIIDVMMNNSPLAIGNMLEQYELI
jgi:hypothetical protein